MGTAPRRRILNKNYIPSVPLPPPSGHPLDWVTPNELAALLGVFRVEIRDFLEKSLTHPYIARNSGSHCYVHLDDVPALAILFRDSHTPVPQFMLSDEACAVLGCKLSALTPLLKKHHVIPESNPRPRHLHRKNIHKLAAKLAAERAEQEAQKQSPRKTSEERREISRPNTRPELRHFTTPLTAWTDEDPDWRK